MSSKIEVETPGKGRLTINLEACKTCESKACTKACPVNLIKLDEAGLPVLDEKTSKVCTDCLACEDACSLEGKGGLTIVYPMPELEQHVQKLEAEGVKVVWRR
ncbi:hypothetical protein DRO53_02135 [Candidatus Bathyarchaeota archaeon]|nr:MAG: hypothetical protein DRO53_02135 [Candidatus Bathyarchaeota archaeon]